MAKKLSAKKFLERLLEDALSALHIPFVGAAFSVTLPEPRFGDYTTNAPLVLAGVSRRSARALAEELARKIKALDVGGLFTEIATADGFVNFRLADSIIEENLRQILKTGENYGRSELLKQQKIMVEYTDPNPFKEFHIGHLMSNAIGEAIARVIEACGAQVLRANWQGDVGIHVANAVWGLRQMELVGKISKLDLIDKFNNVDIRVLGQAYAWGVEAFEKDGKEKNDIVVINKILYGLDKDKTESQWVTGWYRVGRTISLDYLEKIYKRLGTKFDHYFFESKEGVEGKAIVEARLQDGIFEKSEGAVVFRGEKFGLHTRVFINAAGLPTYEAKELGLNKRKFEVEPGLDKSIIVTGNEIKAYFAVLLAVMALIFPDIAKKTVHLSHGMLRLPSGKMSSRTGSVITAERLLSELKRKVMRKISKAGLTGAQKTEIAEVVAIGALKYSILKQDPGRDIIFDFEKSLAFEGDSGPYLQYTHARARSVLKKAESHQLQPEVVMSHPASELERWLYRYPEVVERAGAGYAPNLLAGYLLALASRFNQFYSGEKIVDGADSKSPHRLAITAAVAQVIKNGLYLLGITAPEEM